MRIVQIRFPGSKRLYDFQAGDLDVFANEVLVVEGERGLRLGSAVDEPAERDWTEEQPPPKAVRKARDEDLLKAQDFKAREDEATTICRESIGEHRLPMKLVKSEYIFDGSKVIFYFTAEGRVDFRELVRKLAQQLRTRIEMYQIGVRDEAKLMGGLGICGRVFCCTSWLNNFTPVSIRMAKNQGLSLNPTKVSGGCGRLLCCLAYEHEVYAEFRKGLPKIGKRALTPSGIGRVTRYDIFTDKVFIFLESGKEEGFGREEVKPYSVQQNQPPSGPGGSGKRNGDA
ncbi:MAG: stage 0 sporulation family protein [Candidatus Lernaella stagnicola]|nr:stage 0 sporulation family protein [Candidatus Lernaella stagnicola]